MLNQYIYLLKCQRWLAYSAIFERAARETYLSNGYSNQIDIGQGYGFI